MNIVNQGNRPLCEKSFEVPNLWQRDMYISSTYYPINVRLLRYEMCFRHLGVGAFGILGRLAFCACCGVARRGGYFAASAIIIAGQGTLVLLIAHDFRPSKRCHFVRNFALNSLKNHEHETWFERCQLWSRERRRKPKAPGRHFASGISESSREIEERGRRRSQG